MAILFMVFIISKNQGIKISFLDYSNLIVLINY